MGFKVYGMMKDFQVVSGRVALEGLKLEASKHGTDLVKEAAARGIDFDADLSNDKVLYFRAKMLGYDLPNGNGDAISRIYAADFGPSFIGKHLDLNHETDVENIIGKVVSTFHVEASLPGEPGAERIIGLNALADDDSDATRELQLDGICRIDRNTELGELVAQKLIAGTIDGVSQEASTDFATCSVCEHKIGSPFDRPCEHLENGSLMVKAYQVQGKKNKVLAFKNHANPVGTGLAVVPVPAYDRGRVQQMREQVRAGKMDVKAALLDLKVQALLNKKPEHIMQAIAELEAGNFTAALDSALTKLNGHETLALMEKFKTPAVPGASVKASQACLICEDKVDDGEEAMRSHVKEKHPATHEANEKAGGEYVKAAPAFNNWLDTFVSEKGIDLEETFDVEGPSGTNVIPYGVIVEHMKTAGPAEQAKLKNVMVAIDFKNGDVRHFFRHLGQAIAAGKAPEANLKAEWKDWKTATGVEVVTAKGVEEFASLEEARAKYPTLDPESNGKDFTWAMKGSDGKMRFEDWGTNDLLSAGLVKQRLMAVLEKWGQARGISAEAALLVYTKSAKVKAAVDAIMAKDASSSSVSIPKEHLREDMEEEQRIIDVAERMKRDDKKALKADIADLAITETEEGRKAAENAGREAEKAKAALAAHGLGEISSEAIWEAEAAAKRAQERFSEARQLSDAVLGAKFFRQPRVLASYWAITAADGSILLRVTLGALSGGQLDRSLVRAGKTINLADHLTTTWGTDLVAEVAKRGADAVLAELEAAQHAWDLKASEETDAEGNIVPELVTCQACDGEGNAPEGGKCSTCAGTGLVSEQEEPGEPYIVETINGQDIWHDPANTEGNAYWVDKEGYEELAFESLEQAREYLNTGKDPLAASLTAAHTCSLCQMTLEDPTEEGFLKHLEDKHTGEEPTFKRLGPGRALDKLADESVRAAGRGGWVDRSTDTEEVYEFLAPAGNGLGKVWQTKPVLDDQGNKVEWETEWGYAFRRGPQQSAGKARSKKAAMAIVEDPNASIKASPLDELPALLDAYLAARDAREATPDDPALEEAYLAAQSAYRTAKAANEKDFFDNFNKMSREAQAQFDEAALGPKVKAAKGKKCRKCGTTEGLVELEFENNTDRPSETSCKNCLTPKQRETWFPADKKSKVKASEDEDIEELFRGDVVEINYVPNRADREMGSEPYQGPATVTGKTQSRYSDNIEYEFSIPGEDADDIQFTLDHVVKLITPSPKRAGARKMVLPDLDHSKLNPEDGWDELAKLGINSVEEVSDYSGRGMYGETSPFAFTVRDISDSADRKLTEWGLRRDSLGHKTIYYLEHAPKKKRVRAAAQPRRYTDLPAAAPNANVDLEEPVTRDPSIPPQPANGR